MPMSLRKYRVDRIDGLPPKKDGANSMWNKDVETTRLIKLRESVKKQMNGDEPLSANIRISLQLHASSAALTTIGDLDNFITGICDGLMAAHCRAQLHDRWNNTLSAITPSKPIAITDDSKVVEICATKVGDSDEPWYSLELVGM
jgi:hypothetical protein